MNVPKVTKPMIWGAVIGTAAIANSIRDDTEFRALGIAHKAQATN